MERSCSKSKLDFITNSFAVGEFIIKSNFDFEQERSKLVQMVHDLGAKGENAIKLEIHPFFGKMSKAEWGILFYKHLNHHLDQFSA